MFAVHIYSHLTPSIAQARARACAEVRTDTRFALSCACAPLALRRVLTVALNLVRSRWRTLLRRYRRAVTRPATGDEDIATAEWLMVIRSLPRRPREVAALHYIDDLSIARIAEITALSEGVI